jgi:hypothetical protein
MAGGNGRNAKTNKYTTHSSGSELYFAQNEFAVDGVSGVIVTISHNFDKPDG